MSDRLKGGFIDAHHPPMCGRRHLAVALSAPALAADEATILGSVPGLSFPFFVHMMKRSRTKRQAGRQR